MTRSISAPTLAQAAAGVSQPLYLLEINWASGSSYLCSHSTVTWNGQTWAGAGMEVTFDADGKPSSIRLQDPTDEYRTEALSGGISDRPVNLWKAYIGALAASDPALLFSGYADGCEIGRGEFGFGLGYALTSALYTPRHRIGPAIGVNFLGAPGTKIHWANQIITLEKR